MLNILTSNSKAENVSLAVAIAVIILLFIVCAGMFYLYYKYFGKCIDNRLEDSAITRDLVLENKEYFEKGQKCFKEGGSLPAFADHIIHTSRKSQLAKIIANFFLVVFYIIISVLMVGAIYIRSSGETFFFMNYSYLIVQTGSMQEANSSNTYLRDNNLDNQIDALSLIAITPVDEADINLYDVAAFYDNDNHLIIHRIIAIEELDGDLVYTMRGDANNVSASYERHLPYEAIVGIWTGFENYGLGITIQYLQSGIGIISLALGLILVGFYDALDIVLGKKVNARRVDLIWEMDEKIEEAFNKNVEFFPYSDLLEKKSYRTRKKAAKSEA